MKPIKLDELVARIETLVTEKTTVVVALSGFGGSGKSSIARKLTERLADALVVPLDAFITNRLLERSNDWTGFDWERLERQVLRPIKAGAREIEFEAFDWPSCSPGKRAKFPVTKVVIVEGVGLIRDRFADYFDLTVWIDVPIEVATERGRRRDVEDYGVDHDRSWRDIWEPNERDYFEKFQPAANADVILLESADIHPAAGQLPYTSLSAYYDEGWGTFALSYLPFLLEEIERRSLQSPRLLDICCGTGLLAKALAEKGIHVVGVDRSEEMIKCARKNCSDIPFVEFNLCEMTEIAFESEFDLITCTFDSINYLLESADLLKFFNRVAAALKSEGQFIFDSNTHNSYSSWSQGEYTEIRKEISGVPFRQLLKFDPQRSLAEIKFEFPNGASEVHFQRPWDEEVLREILSDSGLSVVWIKEASKRIFILTNKRYHRPTEQLIN